MLDEFGDPQVITGGMTTRDGERGVKKGGDEEMLNI